MDIRFYDFEFNLVYIVSDWTSVNWELHYNKVGTFELHLPLHTDICKMLENNKYLVAIQGDKQAIITGKMLSDEIVIHGRTTNWILTKRVILPFVITKETQIGEIILTNLGKIFDQQDNFYLPQTIVGSSTINSYELKKAKDASTFLIEMCEQSALGHRVKFIPSKHRWELEILKGDEKHFIISQDNKNAYQPKLTWDNLDMCNGIYYKDANDTYRLIPSNKLGIYRWYDVSENDNLSDAKADMSGHTEHTMLTYNTTYFLHGKDYMIGDSVFVETSFGGNKKRQKKVITGIRIWNEGNSDGECPIFGEKENDADAN
ncbi:MAG: hypothetical protein PHE51_10375 [Eubacteriales bacterium]|nr:hypothetical protein [Eubacteriales bacterium]